MSSDLVNMESARPEVLVFDVNETLLDLAGLRQALAAALGSAATAGEWFPQLLHGSLVANHLGRYRSFEAIGVDALIRVAHRHGVALDPDAAAEVVAGIRSMPPHPEVIPALQRLEAAGFRLATLTNSAADTVTDQLANAGIAGFFETALSVDEVRRFKPAPEVYLMATVRLRVDVEAMLMVAAHDWDVLGARSVGIPGAFIARPGAFWGMPEPAPDLTVPDLAALADRLGA